MNQNDRTLYGIKLRIMMKKKGISPRDCAYKLGCSERTLLRWLKGETVPILVFREKLKEMFPNLEKKQKKQ